MESEVLVVLTMFSVLLAAVAMLFVRGDGETNRKFAKVRVRVDETRRGGTPEPSEEEFEPGASLQWMVIGSLLFFIVVLLANLYR